MAVVDFIVAAAGYLAVVYATFEIDPGIYLLYEGGLGAIAFTSLTIVAGIYFQELYPAVRLASRVGLAVQLSRALGIAFLVQAVIGYADRAMGLQLPVMLAGSAFALAGLFAWRLLYYRVARGWAGAERILLAGATPLMREIAARIHSLPRGGMTVIGYLDDDVPAGTLLEGAPVLGPMERLDEICKELNPNRVFADFDGDRKIRSGLIKRIVAAGFAIEKASVLYELLFRRVCTARLEPSTVLFAGEFVPMPARMAAQSVCNNLLALAGILLLGPVMLLVALLIKITSGGPVREFEQVAGWKLIPFTLSRFRCTKATPLGRVLRRLRLDALPQLINVLRGELAFLGPRPVADDRVAGVLDSLPYYRLRFSVKPGLIGWSQINLSPADPSAELEYDLYYVKHLSLALDCYILLHALPRLFRTRRSETREDHALRRASNAD